MRDLEHVAWKHIAKVPSTWVHLSRLFGKEEYQTSLEERVPERKTDAVPKGSGVDVAKMCHQVFSPQYSFGCSH